MAWIPSSARCDLGAPTRVQAETSERFADTGPAWSVIQYEFPATELTTSPFKLVWYDGGKRPDPELFGSDSFADWSNGILFLGDEGSLAVDYENMPHLLPAEKFADFKIEAEPEDNHYTQWTSAAREWATRPRRSPIRDR